ncbi:GerAB/ArcD/ProY family transporter [Paenibacillus sp. LMG 31458]|uniref:GerAB/ArcD/ProY family transporter n=1 Tax=Paenibacillus phytorum TaxID=2654977 RepID=A0ABX1XVW0_9BACL|nr:endospore germination permease [Paenibacillus phytorum]NOU72700.1 GerAB/ArcD/ProY family transporter [Paenibacillus phytorum]
MSTFSNPKINPIHGCILCMSGTLALAQISGAIIIIEQAKRDAFVSSIIGCIAYLLYAFWIFKIVNNQAPNQSFLDVLELKMGSLIAWAVKSWIALYLICELFVIDKNVVTWVKSFFLPFTPIWAISLPLLIVCAYLAVKGIKSIAISFSVLMPAILLLILFMAVFTFKYRHFDLLLPLFSEGMRPILEGATTTVRAGMELFLLLLLKPHTEGTFKWKHFVALVSVISFFFINAVMSVLTIFGTYEASKQRFPLFTQWRLVRISSFLEHLDFLSIYQWLCSTAILISLGLFLIGDLLTSKQRHHKIAIVTCTTALFIGVELQINDSNFLAFTKYYFYPISTLSILCWTALAYFTTRKRGLS